MGFGTDGACSMDELEEMRYAALISNYLSSEVDFVLPAYKLLRLATVEGARCLGLGEQVGTIEVGKLADVIVIGLRDAQFPPNTNYHESIVYYAKSRNLTHTIVNGEIVYADGRLRRVDEDKLFDSAQELSMKWIAANRDVLEDNGIWRRIQSHFFSPLNGRDAALVYSGRQEAEESDKPSPMQGAGIAQLRDREKGTGS